MVINECDVSRSTFYRHYSDKYDLMNWCYQSYVDTLIKNVRKGDWEHQLCLIFQFFSDHHQYFEKAFKVQGKNSFESFLYEYSYAFYRETYLKNTGDEELNTEARIALEFNCMGAVYVVRQWLDSGRSVSVTELAKIIFQLIPEMYRKYL